MASQICPNCKTNNFYWRIDSGTPSLTIWDCFNCNYRAFEDESFERVCTNCGKKTESKLKDDKKELWWCSSCNSIKTIKLDLNILVKTFSKLTTNELYDLLQLRSEVFVVEQDCVYQDLDGKDKKAIHVLGLKNDKIVAYTRIFKPGDYFNEASIGRVVVSENERNFKYGYDIMKASIEVIKNNFNTTKIKISAQVYLGKFYNNLGFKAIGEEYLEDGIPHIAMILN